MRGGGNKIDLDKAEHNSMLHLGINKNNAITYQEDDALYIFEKSSDQNITNIVKCTNPYNQSQFKLNTDTMKRVQVKVPIYGGAYIINNKNQYSTKLSDTRADESVEGLVYGLNQVYYKDNGTGPKMDYVFINKLNNVYYDCGYELSGTVGAPIKTTTQTKIGKNTSPLKNLNILTHVSGTEIECIIVISDELVKSDAIIKKDLAEDTWKDDGYLVFDFGRKVICTQSYIKEQSGYELLGDPSNYAYFMDNLGHVNQD